MVDAGANAATMRFEKIAVTSANAPDEQPLPETLPDDRGQQAAKKPQRDRG